ncbi:DMT family transporter [Alphaproteobacteria bacterium KMM 3653]|uniref:DMT family transporter n=1 Tax=Harenicola maris TaxID=2841044 RepID=A0AAP2CND6_9RHOB|nr:DMT family transporter [Harenicola maris]
MDIKAIAMGLGFAVMWASAFTSARFIVVDAPPLTALALRFAVSGVLAVLIALALGQTWRLTRAQARATIIFGLCQNTLYLGMNFYAMQWLQASVATIIASTMPLVVALAGWAFLGEPIRRLGWLGLVMGLAGVALIMGARIGGGDVNLYALSLCIAAVLALSVATLSVKGASSGGNLLMVVGLQMLVGSAALAVVAVLFETWEVNWTPSLIIAFFYTTLVPGLAATLVWFMLVRRVGAVRAAVFHFLTPFLGVAIAAIALSEPFGPVDIIGVVIITLGIWMVQKSKTQPAV